VRAASQRLPAASVSREVNGWSVCAPEAVSICRSHGPVGNWNSIGSEEALISNRQIRLRCANLRLQPAGLQTQGQWARFAGTIPLVVVHGRIQRRGPPRKHRVARALRPATTRGFAAGAAVFRALQ